MKQTVTNDKLFSWLENHNQGIRKAHERFVAPYVAAEIPSRKHEEWKYTDISFVFEQDYQTPPAFNVTEQEFHKLVPLETFATRVVFLNGRFSKDLSMITHAGIIIESLEDYEKNDAAGYDALLDGTKISSCGKLQLLNTIFTHQGVVIRVAKDVTIEQPICIVYINSGETRSVINTRNIFVCESSSRCSFQSFHLSSGVNSFFANQISEIFVRNNAQVSYNQLYVESDNNTTVHGVEVLQEANSTFTASSFLINGSLIRNNIRVAHMGENCVTQLNGLYVPSSKQTFDTFTLVDHKQPNCTTTELYKGVASGSGTGTFVGKIFVAPGAQKTSANQSNRNILLSPESTIHSKPMLEIWADDVTCTHGSTVGQLNADHLFYCQARGISKDDAVRLLLHAFIQEVIDKIAYPEIAEIVAHYLNEKLRV
jgi:Fe-S cluster assembly protein SufD